MKQIKRHSVAVVAGAVLWAVCGSSHGLGMGRASSRTTMGEGLAFTVPVRLDAGEHLDNECLAADVFFGDDKVASANVSVQMVADAQGGPQIKVFTKNAVNEPVVTVYVVAGCHARITRKFVALADPPGMQMPLAGATVAAAETSVPATSAMPVPAPTDKPGGLTRVARAPDVRKHPSRGANARAGRAAGADRSLAGGGAGDPAAARSWPSATLAGSAAKASRGSAAPVTETARLELDPIAADALVAPQLTMGRSLSLIADPESSTPELLARRATAAARWRAMQATPEQLARDQERLAELEQRFAQLQAQGEQAAVPAPAPASEPMVVAVAPPVASQVAAPEAAEGQRASRTMGLVGLAVAAVLGGGYVFWRRRALHGKADEAWWQEQAGETHPPSQHDAEPNDPHPTTVEFVHVPESLLRRAGHGPVATSPFGADAVAAAPSMLPSSQQAGAQFTSMFASLHAQVPEPLRAVAVEELIDLEQQAEFFVVLGQDDAAIELLEGYVQHTLGGSPLPFLKLLEVYRRLNRRPDYERTQQAFDARFNARAPAWDADMQQGHSLADYPEVVARLQALWQQPAQAMAVLEKSLTRPVEGEDTFDLPAYRELLMLYAVARDLAERSGPGGGVDLLLPLGGETPDSESGSTTLTGDAADVSPLMATRPLTVDKAPQAMPGPRIEVDLQLDDVDGEPLDRPTAHRH